MCFDFFGCCSSRETYAPIGTSAGTYGTVPEAKKAAVSSTSAKAEELFRNAMRFRQQEDFAKSIQAFGAAYKEGHKKAWVECEKDCYQLGMIYKRHKDLKEAFEWFEMAGAGLKGVSEGHGEAQCELGGCYLRGDGTEKNKEEARKWLLLAKKHGVRQAEFMLQIMDTGSATISFGGGTVSVSGSR